MSKKIKIIIAIVIVLVAVVAVAWYFLRGRENQDMEVNKRIKGEPRLVEIYNKVKDYQSKPQDAENLIAEGFNWKSLGELTQDQYFFQKALGIYELGIQKFGE
ncbi:MAG: hypothetical protein NTU97_02550, partial [Candidatus Magasanikbacteria bacterium]|nr:hypothetical protein [Candidatus Magasanikbacteria bacterium]